MALLLPVALLAGGLVAGMLLWSAIGGVPWMRRLSGPEYVRLHRFWSPRFDPLAPVAVLITVAADVALLAAGPARDARPALVVAVAALAGVIAVSAARAAPLKRRVLALDPDRLPDDFAARDPRAAWQRWNLARTVLAVGAFAANAVAVGLLLPA
ncbi:anthrone oxygenase family protein [Micromonospora sp. NPDC048170]|uniref:anthrone oxygenase family protein n=1 Tax=Micromonospora sp. NPDC048170 TaxID=3154819 RepID=UPI0033DA6995